MKVLSTDGLTKLIQLIKSSFISVNNVTQTTEVNTETTSEITLATVATSGSYNDLTDKPNLRNIGEIVTSTIPLSDAGLHLLDGALISGSGSYAYFVDYIAGLVNTYPDLFETEANWQTSVTNYGVCGKFVYDSVNNTVRLPKITGFTEGTINPTVLGDLVTAGLPNITGHTGWIAAGGANDAKDVSGAIGYIEKGSHAGIGGGGDLWMEYDINASRSSSIYGNSNTVQPQAIKVLYYIVIATSVKTQIEVDIDEIATDLNGKADVDLSNLNASGKSLASGLGMPGNNYVDITLGASDSFYTAPANGWMLFMKEVTDYNQWMYMGRNTSNLEACGIGGSSGWARIFFPVKKGDTFLIAYSAAGSSSVCRFIYAKGEN